MRAMSGPLLNLHFDAPRPTPLLIAPRQPPIAVIDADLVGDAITNVLACDRAVVVGCKARRWRHTRPRDRARRRGTGRACPSRCRELPIRALAPLAPVHALIQPRHGAVGDSGREG